MDSRTDGQPKGNPIPPFRNYVAMGDNNRMKGCFICFGISLTPDDQVYNMSHQRWRIAIKVLGSFITWTATSSPKFSPQKSVPFRLLITKWGSNSGLKPPDFYSTCIAGV